MDSAKTVITRIVAIRKPGRRNRKGVLSKRVSLKPRIAKEKTK